MHTNVIVAVAEKGVVPVLFMKTNQFGSFLLVTSTGNLRRGCSFEHIICAHNVQCKVKFTFKIVYPAFARPLLGALGKLRRATVSFVMSVLIQELCFNRADFHEIFTFEYFSKICGENSGFINVGQEFRVLYMKNNIHF